jgi:dienelactone hydrolase
MPESGNSIFSGWVITRPSLPSAPHPVDAQSATSWVRKADGSLTCQSIVIELFTYPGTQHGFNNDTTPRYDKAAADLAWKRTMDFFKQNLRG